MSGAPTRNIRIGRPSRFGAIAFGSTLIAGAICVVCAAVGRTPAPMVSAICFALLLAVVGAGVALPASGVFARPVLHARTGRHEVALTFDDGPDPRWTTPVLDLLDARQQRATFFVIGARAERHPELLREITRRGHEVANHSWFHSYLTVFKSPRTLARELERTNSVVCAATGTRPRWFRTPVGLLSPRIPEAARLAGLELVSWSTNARDGVARTTVAQALKRLEGGLVPGAILVLHDARLNGLEAPVAHAVLTLLLDRMDAKGLRSVTLSELCE